MQLRKTKIRSKKCKSEVGLNEYVLHTSQENYRGEESRAEVIFEKIRIFHRF